jgi:hypothetical protein
MIVKLTANDNQHSDIQHYDSVDSTTKTQYNVTVWNNSEPKSKMGSKECHYEECLGAKDKKLKKYILYLLVGLI